MKTPPTWVLLLGLAARQADVLIDKLDRQWHRFRYHNVLHASDGWICVYDHKEWD